eukprot:TRINITY_DN9821_c0_g1_i1.p1 TRINITY_DN9821_c0_g1~~TRINITY_DN9821_c0_g1_i1.p1  ORF type:complete len:739 (+),score=137.56 TRINITY_DN9821_c0_g1_i1:250-2217(+)
MEAAISFAESVKQTLRELDERKSDKGEFLTTKERGRSKRRSRARARERSSKDNSFEEDQSPTRKSSNERRKHLQAIAAMGFPEDEANAALDKFSNSLQTAIDYLIANQSSRTKRSSKSQTTQSTTPNRRESRRSNSTEERGSSSRSRGRSNDDEDVDIDDSENGDKSFASSYPREKQLSSSLWIGNVSPKIREEELRTLFAPHGEIVSLKILRRSQCAFVNYSSPGSATAAKRHVQGKILRDMRLEINFSKPPKSQRRDDRSNSRNSTRNGSFPIRSSRNSQASEDTKEDTSPDKTTKKGKSSSVAQTVNDAQPSVEDIWEKASNGTTPSAKQQLIDEEEIFAQGIAKSLEPLEIDAPSPQASAFWPEADTPTPSHQPQAASSKRSKPQRKAPVRSRSADPALTNPAAAFSAGIPSSLPDSDQAKTTSSRRVQAIERPASVGATFTANNPDKAVLNPGLVSRQENRVAPPVYSHFEGGQLPVLLQPRVQEREEIQPRKQFFPWDHQNAVAPPSWEGHAGQNVGPSRGFPPNAYMFPKQQQTPNAFPQHKPFGNPDGPNPALPNGLYSPFGPNLRQNAFAQPAYQHFPGSDPVADLSRGGGIPQAQFPVDRSARTQVQQDQPPSAASYGLFGWQPQSTKKDAEKKNPNHLSFNIWY